jgi:ABC-type antimicrobial peptide transport system permease subunit
VLLEGGKALPARKQDLPFFTEFFAVLGGMTLLIACANLTNMILAKANERRREIAVRLSLGAGRARLVRQLLTESMLLASGGGSIGFCLSLWLMRRASHMNIPYPTPVEFDVSPDLSALIFALGITLFSGVALGLAPALRATRCDVAPP